MSNSKDYRMSLINEVEADLTNHFTPEQVAIISHIVTKRLSEYEIAERCTDLIVYDDTNERLLKRFDACMIVDGRSKNTIRNYNIAIRKLGDVIQKPYTQMNTYDIRFFLAMEQERGLSASSLDQRRASLSAFFQWLADDEIIPKNPVSKLKPIKVPEVVRKPFSEIEIDNLRSACQNQKERAIIEVLLATGVRVDELSKMNVSDINFDSLTVHVKHGKGNKERTTYITPVAVAHLLKYLKTRDDGDDALVLNLFKQRIETNGVRWLLDKLGERAGVENVHPHRFRRTFATMLAKRGMKVEEIQRLMGHSNINTTMKYICLDDTGVHASYKKHIA